MVWTVSIVKKKTPDSERWWMYCMSSSAIREAMMFMKKVRKRIRKGLGMRLCLQMTKKVRSEQK
jgi:hypothetical protein